MTTPRPKVNPVVWRPPPAPARSRRGTSSPPLPPVTTLDVGAPGPEDVAVGDGGMVYTGTEDGRILQVDTDSGRVETLAETGGRPLGLEMLGDAVLVCDAYRGLLRLDLSTGALDTLCTETAGVPLHLCNNAAVATDGAIYFTDSSQRFTLEHWRADLVEHSGTGRLLRRDPEGEVAVLLDGLHFGNGVALAADESFVAVAETGGYTVRRVWLTGERAGQADMLADNLPGFPDNIARGSDGLIWIALANARNRMLDMLLPRPPLLRRAVWAIPERLQPAPTPTTWVMALDDTGRVVHDFQRSDEGQFHFVTGVREAAGRVYMGTLVGTAIAWFDLPA